MAESAIVTDFRLDRLLDPDNDKVQLKTVQRAAAALGRTLHIELA